MTTSGPVPLLPAAVTALAGDDAEARRRLRRMKAVATGLLVAAAAVFLTTLALPDSTAVGFVQAASEAAMVGALADWFAVTALFRHPLGLRIPHTALVPRQKDRLATQLGEFVTGHFLTPDAVAQHVAEAQLVRRAADHLADERAARRVAGEMARTASGVLGSFDDRHVSEAVLVLVRRDVHRRSYARVLGSLLETAVRGRGHEALVEVVVRHLRSYLSAHGEELVPQLRSFIESNGFLASLWASDRKVRRLLARTVEVLAEMEAQGATHPNRRWLDRLLTTLAEDLQRESSVAATVDEQLRQLLDDERVEQVVHRVAGDVLATVRAALGSPDEELQRRLADVVQDVARRVADDEVFAQRLERALERTVRHVVAQYGDQVVQIIQQTVARWDGGDAADRIEVAVGRDLQFIRINGTLVGAIAGLAIHTVAVLAP